MRLGTGTVVNGTVIVDDPEFNARSAIFVLAREHEGEGHLFPEELAELDADFAEADRVEVILCDEVLARLRCCG